MDEIKINELKLSLRKIIVAHSHVISRVREGDDRTMRVHLLSMLEKLETEIHKIFPDAFRIKSITTIKLMLGHLFKRPFRLTGDNYVDQVVGIMQAYKMQIRVAEKKLSDKNELLKEKAKISRQAAGSLFQIKG